MGPCAAGPAGAAERATLRATGVAGRAEAVDPVVGRGAAGPVGAAGEAGPAFDAGAVGLAGAAADVRGGGLA
ncbi:hypothetical protein [Streptomyces sp. SJL17-4]|uniref:hypothetical protein n=1 Tax=Streptomyces sp. SJL17-4 TaxID=2967224 RepID=UPI0030CE2D79